MKLYEFAPAPNAIRVRIFLAELGIEIERVNVNTRAGENLSSEYKRRAINGKIPYLELDNSHPQLKRWLSQLEQRPSIQSLT